MATRPSQQAVQDAFAEKCRRARAGDADARWADQAIRRAGYAPVSQTAGDRFLATAQQVAAAFAVTERTIRRWIRDGLPVHQPPHGNQPALYDLAACLRWRDQQEAARQAAAGDGSDKDRWLSEMRRQQSIRLEMSNRQRRGELVEVALIDRAWSEIGVALRTRLEPLCTAYGPEVQRQVIDALDEATRAALAVVTAPAPTPTEDSPDATPDAPQPPARPRRRAQPGRRRAGRRPPARPVRGAASAAHPPETGALQPARD